MTKFKIAKTLSLFVLIIQLAFPANAMDLARAECRTDLAVSTFGVTGQGVIVAIIDRGIDWRNNDFRNADGSTRIKFIFDMTDNTGANDPNNPYGVGTIYTEAQINAANAGGTALVTRDAVGHGTTTTGIAAGNGRNHPTNKYRGIAPEASIISIKFTTEGAPAHDGQPAEAPFYNPALFPKALDFVRDKAVALDMPAVMLGNFGSINGPTDGTDEIARAIDAAVGPGVPGLVFVTGSSDDGGAANHAGGVLTQGQSASIQIQKATAGPLRLDFWYQGTDRFTVSMQTPSGTFGPYAPPANGSSQQLSNSAFYYFHGGVGQVFYGAVNQKREIFFDLLGPAGTYTLQLTGTTVADGKFDGTMNPSNLHSANQFLNFVVPGSIWTGATAFNNICPNDYVLRTHWTDVDGIARSQTGEGEIGNLWIGSGIGPTFDGRLGVDLSAPGESVFTTLNPTSYFSVFRSNHIQDGNGFYTRASAVSAAAPQVTGLIALILQKNRHLDAIQVREILRRSARRDSFTGLDPNPKWGYGKMDSLNAITIVADGFEGDVAPRPSGDNLMLSTDLTQLRRFITGLDTPNGETNEVQRIDCAPRSTGGDGMINSADIVQGRRYVAGLDPTTLSGGPTVESFLRERVFSRFEGYSQVFGREIRVGVVEKFVGKTVTIPVEIVSLGNEAAMSFTLEYDGKRLSNPRLSLADGVPNGAILTANTNEPGRIGVLIDGVEPMTASAMPQGIVLVTFDLTDKSNGAAAFSLTGSVAAKGVSDAFGNDLPTKYIGSLAKEGSR